MKSVIVGLVGSGAIVALGLTAFALVGAGAVLIVNAPSEGVEASVLAMEHKDPVPAAVPGAGTANPEADGAETKKDDDATADVQGLVEEGAKGAAADPEDEVDASKGTDTPDSPEADSDDADDASGDGVADASEAVAEDASNSPEVNDTPPARTSAPKKAAPARTAPEAAEPAPAEDDDPSPFESKPAPKKARPAPVASAPAPSADGATVKVSGQRPLLMWFEKGGQTYSGGRLLLKPGKYSIVGSFTGSPGRLGEVTVAEGQAQVNIVCDRNAKTCGPS